MAKLGRLPSPALVVAIVALILALGGTAVAALSGKDKKKVRNIADQEITKKAPGLSVANAANLGGVAPSGYVQGGGHSYFGTKSGANPSTGNVVLSIPGIADITFDCAANGVDSTLHIKNTSGSFLNDVGQNQSGAGGTLNPPGPNLSNGASFDLVRLNSANNAVADMTLQLWNSQNGKEAQIEISNVFCDYGASAVTNQ